MGNEKCKGMQDLPPDDMQKFRYIEDVFRDCCGKWGYQEVRTPTLEYLHLFTSTGTLTPSMLGKVYSFLDWDGWSGERVVLRPDGTIPVARLYIDNLSKQETARLFYVTNIFAFEETGRDNRERWQCGAEFLGGLKPMAEAEVIMLAREVMHKLGFQRVELCLSHAGLLKSLIRELKLDPGEEAKLISHVLEGDWQPLLEAKSSNSDFSGILSVLLGLKGKSSGFLLNVKALSLKNSLEFNSNLEDFISVATLLDSLSLSYEIDLKAIRGFEYYTGICFQLFADGTKIGSGGRYDDLIPLMGGKTTPACGFALYVDPILKQLPLESKERNKLGIIVKAVESTPEITRTCFTLAQSLRNAGKGAVLDFAGSGGPGYRWNVLVSGKKASPFVLIDCEQGQRRELGTIEEIVNYLQSV